MPTTTTPTDAELARSLEGDFTSAHADVNGVRLHHVSGGRGEPLVLLAGWPHTWWEYRKVMPALAAHYRVIVVDLRGMGGSDKPDSGYDKKTMARDIYELLRHLGLESVNLVGHDIGAMVAYALAANHPEVVRKLMLLDVAHPDENFNEMRLLPQSTAPADAAGYYLWWFAFNQVTELPEKLLVGRFRHLVDYFADLLAEVPEAIDEQARQVYTHAYDSADGIRAGNGWYQAFGQDVADLKTYQPVTMPLLALGGAANYSYLKELLPRHGTNVSVELVADSGHYLPEEQPETVVRHITGFFG
ncbi:alpha/beta fold hydrolase [Streptomyces sp. NPDC057743]|uniref:alpha/beta fold hydrolase n=1 Tax=Streptomyces sp. NPDC057743 TaxID=3346236 RepID=UPI0036849A21